MIRAHDIQLTDEDRAVSTQRFHRPGNQRTLRGAVPSASDQPPLTRDGEVVLVMGLPGAGKSTVARDFVTQGTRG